jgi:glycosyltransferase involved in cell wall biosynthesis
MPAMADEAIRRTGAIGDVTVVFSRHTAERLRSAGIPNVVEMFPPMDVDQDRAGESAEALRLRLDLGPLPILYAAHLDSSSGIREAILAMARLPEPLREATLVLAVRWRTGQNVEAAIADLNAVAIEAGVADRVRWITRVDDMLALIAACRLTALVPRELDGKMDLPLVLLESLALGRPVVLADWPPLNEALLGGGLAVPFGDPAALAEAFAQLLSRPDLRSELADAGRRQVKALSDPAVAVALYDEAYQLAVSRHPGRRRAA